MAFKAATKKKSRARVALLGPAGSGKTFTALRIAHALAPGGRIAVFDTERGSASKYVGDPNPDGGVFAFDSDDNMEDFDVRKYIAAVEEASRAGYDVLVIDSMSHAWAGKGGLLEFVDSKADKFGKGWREATPLHNKLIDTILSAPLHIVATMRTKMEYIQDRDSNGKTTVRKVGLQPVQRDGLEYEFDVILDMDGSRATVGKTRCSAIGGKSYYEPGADIAKALREWLDTGDETKPATPPTPPAEAPHDPSWEADRPGFCAALANPDIDASYDEVKAWCLANNRPKPSAMTHEQRGKVLDFLRSDAGKAKLTAFLSTNR